MSNKIIPIVFSTDDNYVLPLSVAIQSLKNTLSEGYSLKIYIFHENLSDESCKKLTLLKRDKCDIIFYNEFKELDNLNLNTIGRMTKATYFRLYACEVLKEYKKIVYLDCDILVQQSIGELYNIDIKDYLIAGVYDWGFSRQNMIVADDYVNAGVLLFNVEKYNLGNCKDKSIDYIKNNPNLPWMDQDIINAVCHGQIKNIDNKFDFMTFFVYDYKKQKSVLKEELKYQQIKSVKDIVLIHYTGQKPWNIKNIPLSDKWWKVVKTLPKELQKDIKNKYKPKKVYGKIGYFFHKISVKLKLILTKGKNQNAK